MKKTALDSLFLLLSLRVGAHAHKDGAPVSACLTMAPGHQGTTPQDLSNARHKIEFARAPSATSAVTNTSSSSSSSANGRKVWLVTLGPKVAGALDSGFKGFFVQARATSPGDVNRVGKENTIN